MDENPYAPPTTLQSSASTAARDDQRYRGIGGWLILVMLGLFITPIGTLATVASIHVPIFMSGRFGELTDPASPEYHPLWVPLLPLEAVGNVLCARAAIVGLVLMFRKSRYFPKWMIGFYLYNVMFMVGDFILAGMIPAVAAQDMSEAVGGAARAVVGAAIWVPYMCVSKRVKATFVE